jgi:chromosome partitioning protein
MIVISIINQKGGVGKTTTAANLSAGLSKSGKNTLFIDLDPQGNGTSCFNIEGDVLEKTIYTLFTSKEPDFKGTLINVNEKLSIIPANLELSNVEIELSSAISRETKLKKLLNEIKGFDITVIDCPPSLGLLTVNALAASNYIIIPVTTSYFPIKGLNSLYNTIELVREINPTIDVLGILISRYVSSRKISKELKETLYNTFDEKMFETVIRESVSVENSFETGKPIIFQNDEKASGYVDYHNFTNEVLKRIECNTK